MIAAQAQILLFDEPTSGLDYRHMREVAELLKRLAAEGKTIFVSTHDPELIVLCCDKIIRITEGTGAGSRLIFLKKEVDKL